MTYCVGAGCETVRPEANSEFVEATTRLNMALELGGEEFDRDDMRFFKGTRRHCHIKLFGLSNCCKNSGALIGLGDRDAMGEGLGIVAVAGDGGGIVRLLRLRHVLGLHQPLDDLHRAVMSDGDDAAGHREVLAPEDGARFDPGLDLVQTGLDGLGLDRWPPDSRSSRFSSDVYPDVAMPQRLTVGAVTRMF